MLLFLEVKDQEFETDVSQGNSFLLYGKAKSANIGMQVEENE